MIEPTENATVAMNGDPSEHARSTAAEEIHRLRDRLQKVEAINQELEQENQRLRELSEAYRVSLQKELAKEIIPGDDDLLFSPEPLQPWLDELLAELEGTSQG